jgi:hypothetical protein
MADDVPVQVAIPADIDAPDRVLYGLTVRQVAILAGTGGWLWLAYRALCPPVPAAAVGLAAVPVAAVAAVLALGRRDGISLDRWVTAALVAARSPRLLVAAGDGLPAVPGWAPLARLAGPPHRRRALAAAAPVAVAPLRLPATAISESGVVDVDDGQVTLTAVSTINVDLRTAGEQSALVEGLGRWLNTLSTPAQIVVSTRPADMDSLADTVERQLRYLSHPALADAAAGYADFLRWLRDDRDPLDRRVVIAHRADGKASGHADGQVVRRHAEQTARAIAGLGAAAAILDGGLVTDVLGACCEPWRIPRFGRSTPGAVITGQTGNGPQ